MKYMLLEGNTKKYSKIALGTTYFGTSIDEKSSLKMLDLFADKGGTTIDTALVYGQERDGGESRSQKIVGKWLKSNNMYHEMTIISKGLHPSLETKESRISLENLKRDLDQSFTDLTVSELDLWFFHRDDTTQKVSHIISLLDEISSYFPVTSFGVSNWETQRIEEALAYKGTKISASEIQWSLACTSSQLHEDDSLVCMDEKQLTWYKTHNLPLFSFSSQAKGFFCKYLAGDFMNEKLKKRFMSVENIEKAKRVKHLSEIHQCPVSSIVLSYITSAPFPSVAIIGPSKIEQLTDSLQNSTLTLDESERHFLESGEKEHL